MREVAEGVATEFEVIALAAVHRTGHLAIGDAAVLVAASAAPPGPGVRHLACPDRPAQGHRTRWKHQIFEDGTEEWVNSP